MCNAQLDEDNPGILLGGRKINNLRYADDTTLIAENEDDLKSLLRAVQTRSAEMGLMLNLQKTKVMSNTDLQEFEIGGNGFEVVQHFTFLAH